MATSRRAVGQVEQGAHPDEVAQALGMTRAAVYGWLAKYREGGLEALNARPVPQTATETLGRAACPPVRAGGGQRPPPAAVRACAVDAAMVRELIGRKFGVRLSEVSVGRLLRKLGLSPQRPLYRANQPNPEAVARWKAEQYPAIREQAAEVGATIYFADEAGVRSDYHAGTTWAPVGRTRWTAIRCTAPTRSRRSPPREGCLQHLGACRAGHVTCTSTAWPASTSLALLSASNARVSWPAACGPAA
jgi:transposase